MRKLIVFNNVSLDGYFAGVNGDISWFQGKMDPEFTAFTLENTISGGALLFGRILISAVRFTPGGAE